MVNLGGHVRVSNSYPMLSAHIVPNLELGHSKLEQMQKIMIASLDASIRRNSNVRHQ